MRRLTPFLLLSRRGRTALVHRLPTKGHWIGAVMNKAAAKLRTGFRVNVHATAGLDGSYKLSF